MEEQIKEILKSSYYRQVNSLPDKKGIYYAEILEFPGCMAQGMSFLQTAQNLEEAGEKWVENALRYGKVICPPIYRHREDYDDVLSERLYREIIMINKSDNVLELQRICTGVQELEREVIRQRAIAKSALEALDEKNLF
jgi:predicted RNase H-like HicB family nuclease